MGDTSYAWTIWEMSVGEMTKDIKGYFYPGSSQILGGGSSSSNTADTSKNATYINLYLTVQPALIVPDPVKEKLDCDESEELIRHCDRWRRDLETKYQHRKVNKIWGISYVN